MKRLAGAFALAVAGFAQASPTTVHYAIYGSTGAVRADANGTATGIIGTGNAWLNNPTLVNSEHLSSYLVKFWIDPVANLENVVWTFDWLLGYGLRAKSVGVDGALSTAKITETIKLGSNQNGWKNVGGISIGTASTGYNLTSELDLSANTTYTLADASLTANEARGETIWNGGLATEAWAYISATSRVGGSGNLSVSTSTYGIVTAAADVTIAQPLLPDNFPIGDGAGGGNQAPEPGSLALLAVAGFLAGWCRRRDRLKRLPA